jgi:hypothetical protein
VLTRFALDERGTVALRLPLTPPERDHGFSALIEEDIHQKKIAGLSYTVWLLDRIDPTPATQPCRNRWAHHRQRLHRLAQASATGGEFGARFLRRPRRQWE